MSNSFGIFSLNSPILISDATFVSNFIEFEDVLIIARGSLLQIYSLKKSPNIQFDLKYEYQTFGNICRVVPLKHPKDSQANILLILNDLRFSILRYNKRESEIKTMQCGNISSSQGSILSPPYRIAQSASSLLLQINPQVLQFFQILPDSQLSAPINIPIPAKFIKDFDFLGSDDYSLKFAVLTEDFGQNSKLQILDVDPYLQTAETRNHKEPTVVTVKNDSYAIQGLDTNSVIVFNSETAFKFTINATTPPRPKSTTINTTSPLIKFTRMTHNLLIAADSGGNLLSILIQDNDATPAMRIGPINVPIALLKYDNRTLISISTSGESSLIQLCGETMKMHSVATPIMTNSGSLKKIVEVNSNEFIGLCGNGYSHIIRQSLILNEVARIPLMGIETIWFYQDCLVLSVDTQTFIIRLGDNEVEKIENDSFVLDQPTIAFKQTSDNSFIQITPFKVNSNIDGNEINDKGDFHVITDASISSSYVAFIINDESQFTIFVLDYDLNEVRRFEVPVPIEVIAVNDTFMATASWPENKVFVFSIETGSLVRTIEKVNCISLLFTDDYLILAETRDHVIYYPLNSLYDSKTSSADFVSLYCNGMHYKLIPTSEPNDVIVAGECPVLIHDLVVNGIEYHGFKDGAVSDDKFCLIHDDSLSLCRPSHFAITVHEEKSSDDIIDAVQITNPAKATNSTSLYNFVVASNNQDGHFSLSVVEHPLSTLHPTWPKEDEQLIGLKDDESYIGMASIVTDDPMKFLAVIYGQHLILFEVSDDMLLKRSQIDLKSKPFQISTYGNKIIVGFNNEFILYEPEIISHSDIQLKELTDMQTDGATSYISNDDELVAVADELQSLVLYVYDPKPNKFTEHARNCINFGLSICRVAVDDYFVIDYNGNLFQMQIGNSNNTESRDLDIHSCCALGEPCTSMIVLSYPKKDKDAVDEIDKSNGETDKDTQTKLLIGTQSSQYIEVLSFNATEDFEHLYRTIEREVQTVGRMTSGAHRTVLINNSYMLPCPIMYNFDLLKMFLDLDDESRAQIASMAGIDVNVAGDMCRHFLSLT